MGDTTLAIMDTSQSNGEDPNRLTLMLDEIEKRVEHLRGQAAHLAHERETLLFSLNHLQESAAVQEMNQCEREELQVNAERLICRCLTVDISVIVPRDDSQEEALKTVNDYIEGVCKTADQQALHALLSASSSDQQTATIPADQKFQTMLLGCTAEDQKNIRKRLNNLLENH